MRIAKNTRLIALACAANIGSAATLIGNPQNMLIGARLALGFGAYSTFALPVVLAGLLATWAIVAWQHRGRWETTTENAATPCADFTSNLYGLTYAGGAAYDSNANGTIDNNESPVDKTLAGRATAPFIVDQHLVFGAGNTIQVFGDQNDYNNGVGHVGVRILSWRDLR